MADELKIILGSKMNLVEARKQLDAFIKEYEGKEIKLKIGNLGTFSNSIKQVSDKVDGLSRVLNSKLETRSIEEVNKQFGITLAKVNSLEKVKVTGEGIKSFTQEIVKGVDAAGKLITATRNIGKSGRIKVSEKNDYAAEEKTAEKLAKTKERLDDAEDKRTLRLEAKRVTAVNKRTEDERKALEKLAKAKDVEMNKEERRQLQLDLKRINAVNTRVANEQNAAEKIRQAKQKEADAEESKSLKLEAKRVAVVNKRVADEQKALERLAKAKDVELDKEERKQLQLDLKRVNAVNTRVANEQKAAEQVRKANERAADAQAKEEDKLTMKRMTAIAKRISDSQRAAKAESDDRLRVENAYAQLQNRLMRMDSSKVYSMLMGKNKDLSGSRSDIANKMKALNEELANGTLTMEKFKQSGITQDINKLGAELDVAKNKMGGFVAEILSSAQAFAKWYIIGNIISGFKRSLESGIKSIIELDDAMVELRKVTDETNQTYDEFYISANKTAKALGVTTQAVIDATSRWAQMGYSIKDASKLAEDSALFSNISENMNIEDSTATIISTIKAFGLSTNDVLDGVISKINEVGKKVAYIYGDIYALYLVA